MLRLFAENLLPVFLAAGVGYLLAARMKLDPRPVTHVAFYVLAPTFVFDVIVRSRLEAASLLRMGGFAAATLVLLASVAALLARSLRLSRTMVAATFLVVLLPNAGNFGLSANLFAFGEAGLVEASTFFVTSSVLTFTVGVLVASLGRAGTGQAIGQLLRTPAIWSVVIAFLFLRSGWSLPVSIRRTVDLFSAACIPIFLLVLGMQLYGRTIRARPGPLVLASGMRLLGGAVAGLALSPVFGLAGPAYQAGVLQSAMPSAVITTIIAAQYDVEPDFVTSVVVLTTLLCPLTLTPLLALLGAR